MANVTRYTPTILPTLENDPFNSVFRRFFGENLLEPVARPFGWMPAIEIAENNEELLLTAELPGLDAKDVQLTIEDDVLTLRGEKVQEKKDLGEKAANMKFHVFERFYGAFTRSFTLPRAVDPTKIVAEFNKGVLTVRMPKTAQAKGRVVNIATK